MALSPAAFGQRIKQLEHQLGYELFTRSTRTVRLTEAGQQLLPKVRAVTHALNACKNLSAEEQTVELTIGTRHELGLSWILPAIENLMRERKHWQIHLFFGSTEELSSRVHAGEIDGAITSARIHHFAIERVVLHDEHYAFVAAPALLKRKPFSQPEHANHHRLIDISAQVPLFSYLRQASSKLDVRDFSSLWRLGTIAAIRSAVLASMGVAVLPRYFVADDLRKRRLVAILPKLRLPKDQFTLAFRGADPRREQLIELAGFLRERKLT